MVVRSLETKKDSFRLHEDNKELLGPKVPYLSAIGALMYLANNTRPDIIFSVNLLTRYISSPTRRHWNRVKHVLRYLQRMIDLGLFYSNISNSCNLSSKKEIPTILYQNNATCIAQLKGEYIKGDRTKHISPKVFFTDELQKNGEIDVRQIWSCDNLTDLFTKSIVDCKI
ncbi:hypothetical protein M9H77_21507 [Catharanthus roseus]|uniref:Uncharacterized protein n=1 Tax=Catharanthus roseus TaxID=4058 RepID=A0ACC0AMW7_CATRO|nr:hypothetical protein M9H77_21507 [Catharanthus roseus]